MATEPMSIDRAMLLSFAMAVVVALIVFFVDPATPLGRWAPWGASLSLVLLGVLLGHAGHSYRTACANAWPFVLLYVFVGYLRVQIPGAHISPEILHKTQSYGWWVYLFVVALALPIAFAWSSLGVLIAKTFWPLGNRGGTAA